MAHGIEPEYVVSVSSRANVDSGAPTITEIGEVTPVGNLTYADVLNDDGNADLSVEPEGVTQDIADRLVDLRRFPCELNIYRDALVAWRGPLLSCQLQGPTLTLKARGLLYYTRYMTLEADLVYATATDQYTIGKGLVDAYQALTRGNYGIDTSTVGTSGVTRIRHYLYQEGQNVRQRLAELGMVDNGFDFWVDPVTRKLTFAAARGSDLSMSVYADASNIINPNAFWSVGPEDIASHAIGVGTDPAGVGSLLIGLASNNDVRDTWGRATTFVNATDIGEQASINDLAQRTVDARAEQFFNPGPSIFPVADSEPSDFNVGDRINYTIKIGNLGTVNIMRRVRSRSVTVTEDGNEDMSIELV